MTESIANRTLGWLSLSLSPVGGGRAWTRVQTLVALPALALTSCGGGGEGDPGGAPSGLGSVGGDIRPVCEGGAFTSAVHLPAFVANLPGETGWFASPLIVDLDGDGSNEIVAAQYSVFIFDASGERLAKIEHADGRVYAPHVVADLEGDGSKEIVFGSGPRVHAYHWANGVATVKSGYPVDTTRAGESPEVRGLAAADLDGDGTIEIVATTTQTQPTESGGAQVFVWASDGQPYQPADAAWSAWPRYNAASGPGNDADRNGQGHRGYGCYGLNVGIGNVDDDAELEVIATYDNHHIQIFDPDGVALDTSPWFRNRASAFDGARLTWGQFIRWADPQIESDHYHDHVGEWPHPRWAEWLQWTASPPSVADLDRDGRSEIIAIPNIEMHEPYETQAYAVMVLEGNHGEGERAGRRKPGWEDLPRGGTPIRVDGWYPPSGVPAPAIANIQGDERLEIVVSLNDGYTYGFDSDGQRLWRFDHRSGHDIEFASEAAIADLNGDGSPEIIVATYGAPDRSDSGHLVVLAANGALLHDIALPGAGHNGNGNGAPAAPTVGDVDGDGQLEILVQTFDHGIDMFTVPGSGPRCIPWATARGGPRRTGVASMSGTGHASGALDDDR
ncbi:MAG: VCBS repeat-containing protein [Nannocystaceae bacterium]